MTSSLQTLSHQGDFIFPLNFASEILKGLRRTRWIQQNHFNLLELLSLSLTKNYLEQCKYGREALLADWYLLTERLFGQANDMVGCTIQHSRYSQSQNIFISILWAMARISLSLVRKILTKIRYLDDFLSSPSLGLISLNNSFCIFCMFWGLISLNHSFFMFGMHLNKEIQNWLASVKSTHMPDFIFPYLSLSYTCWM